MSLLSWERGLKCSSSRPTYTCYVAPLVGAWIEIYIYKKLRPGFLVAPLVGAWIEI